MPFAGWAGSVGKAGGPALRRSRGRFKGHEPQEPEWQLHLPDVRILTGSPDNPDVVSRARQMRCSASSASVPTQSQSCFHPVCAGGSEQWTEACGAPPSASLQRVQDLPDPKAPPALPGLASTSWGPRWARGRKAILLGHTEPDPASALAWLVPPAPPQLCRIIMRASWL